MMNVTASAAPEVGAGLDAGLDVLEAAVQQYLAAERSWLATQIDQVEQAASLVRQAAVAPGGDEWLRQSEATLQEIAATMRARLAALLAEP